MIEAFFFFCHFLLMAIDQQISIEVSLMQWLQSSDNFFPWSCVVRDSSGGECTHHPSFVSVTGTSLRCAST